MNKRVKVLQIVHGLAPGGIESFILNIYENIDKSDLYIYFVLACEGEQHHEKRVITQGATIYRTCDLNGSINKIKHFIKLITLLKKEGPFDAVHTHIDFFNGINLFAAFLAKVPKRISHAHNTNSANAQKEKASILIKIYRVIMRILINTFATDRVGCSKDANIYMYGKRLGNNEHSKVICNGININQFSKKDNTNEDIDITIDKSKINFVTIGRICEQKNSLFIVRVINELKKIKKDVHLYWIGKGPKENEVIELIKKYNLEEEITFLGTRKDIHKILNNMDFMLFPSKWEGLPVVLVEAQASGVPCFISDTISKEADLGLCTYISLEKNSRQWAEEINNHINNKTYENQLDSDRMSKFDIKNVAKELKKIYIS